jgi:hypothetical protein
MHNQLVRKDLYVSSVYVPYMYVHTHTCSEAALRATPTAGYGCETLAAAAMLAKDASLLTNDTVVAAGEHVHAFVWYLNIDV